MDEWLILQEPTLLILLGLALFLNLYDQKHQKTKGIFTLLSSAVMIFVMAALCVRGADSRELISELAIFLLLNLREKA